jgi:hypothetical protein
VQGTLDTTEGGFVRYQPGAILGSSRGIAAGLVAGIPSTGCMVFPFTTKQELFENIGPDVNDPVSRQQLDAGPSLNLMGPVGTRQIPRHGSPETGFGYDVPGGGFLGGGLPPLIAVTPEFLAPGKYTLDNDSGAGDVGPFSASLSIPGDSFEWTNSGAFGTISRSQDLTVTWTGGTSGIVRIDGSSANPSTQAGAAFRCVAPANGGTFTVPSWVLSALPASGLASDIPAPAGFLMVGTVLTSPSRFQARGVDAGYLSWSLFNLKNVDYQ